MTNGKPIDQAFHGDPEGILPKEAGSLEIHHERVGEVEERSLILTGLTSDQIDAIGEGIKKALSPYQSRTAAFSAKVAQIAILMVALAAAVRLIVWILSGLTVNA